VFDNKIFSHRPLVHMKRIAILVFALGLAASARAAAPDSAQGKSVSNYPNQDNISLGQAREYDHYLQRVLTALRTLDPTMQAEVNEWVVNDRELKRRIISQMQKNPEYRSRMGQNADVVVTQNPRTDDLLRVSVGSVVLSNRQEIEAVLGPSEYDRLKERGYDLLMKNNPAAERKNYGINFSFYRASIQLEKSGFAFEWINGKEEIGYPLWLNGTMTLGAAFIRDNVTARLGIDIAPTEYGNSDSKILGPFTFHRRLLEGTGGASGSLTINNFGLDMSEGRLGAAGLFTYGYNLQPEAGFSLNPTEAHNTNLIGLVYLTYEFPTDGSLAGFGVALGGGAHRIDALHFDAAKKETHMLERTTLGDVFGRISYEHVGQDHYGLALQYSNLLLASAFYDLMEGFGLEMKYSLRMNHRNSPWEYDSYFAISPRISIVL
jgi:hypothetical protein